MSSPIFTHKKIGQQMFCANCGTQLSIDIKFCTKCGTPQQGQIQDKRTTAELQGNLSQDDAIEREITSLHAARTSSKQTYLLKFDQELQRLTSDGWQIINRTDTSAQLRKPKEWSKIGLVVFVLIPLLGGFVYYPLFGIALIGLVFVLLDYLLRKDKLLYLTAEQPM